MCRDFSAWTKEQNLLLNLHEIANQNIACSERASQFKSLKDQKKVDELSKPFQKQQIEEKGIGVIFTIHERQMMMLQLKIEQLRKEISMLMSINQIKQKQTQNLKQLVKKLNVQKKKIPSYKIVQSKLKILQQEAKQWKQKYNESQEIRKQLRLELDASTNRLKRKNQEFKLISERQNKIIENNLSYQQEQVYHQIENCCKDGISSQNLAYFLRKVKSILGGFSELRQKILDCHDFLINIYK